MAKARREIGPIGTASRALVGLGLLFLAGGATVTSWGIERHDAIVGLVAIPGIVMALALVAGRFTDGPIHFMGPLGIAVNCAVIVALVANPYTGGGATLFYGATLLMSAVRGQAGCEATVVSNWLLGREDQIGCPTFTPIDQAEVRARGTAAAVEA